MLFRSTYAMTVTWPLRQVGRLVSQAGMTFVAMSRIDEILKAEEEVYVELNPSVSDSFLKENSVENGQIFDRILGDVEFRNVSFRYKTDDRWALENVSFKVSAGEKVALLGGTGAGKSTIITLLSRFYEPTEGEILLDGRPLSSFDKTWLRTRLGVVHQRAFLFSTTIKENIAFVEPTVDFSKIESVAEASAVASFMDKMPNGYDTVVGEKGVSLSGGQRQRVALARTLLTEPDILILDDATSAVDTETERHIQQSLDPILRGLTAFIIAYRMTTIQNVDKIIVLDKGRILQQGTHAALLETDGFYRQMHDIQMSVESDIEMEMASYNG